MNLFLKDAFGINLWRPEQRAISLETLQQQLIHVLTLAAALCFIGHGAWGIITKSAWVPFFTSVGISEVWAYRLMPFVGGMDIALGLLLISRPMRAIMVWIALWGFWTALLRPIAGQSIWEFWERGGNYGGPICLMICYGAFSLKRVTTAETYMRFFLASLLFGHGALVAIVQKEQFIIHFASIGINLTKQQLMYVGGFEILLGVLLGFKTRLWSQLILVILFWKLFTEFLHVTSGPVLNVFEWIERWGDYGLPVALLYIHRFKESQIKNF